MTKKSSTPPDEETISAVLAGLKDSDTCRKVLSFAKQRCATLQRMGIDAAAADLVQQVVADTLSGGLSWAPGACALSTHFIGAIRSRTHKLRTRHLEFLNRGNQPDRPSEHPERSLEAANVWSQMRDALVEGAMQKGDEEATFVLMAFDDGIHKTAGICEETGMSATQVKNAKRRIWSLMDDLPPDVTDAAKQIGGGK